MDNGIDEKDIRALRAEKYGNNRNADMHADLLRLKQGEPLAYVLNTQPFLGLTVHLDTHPLIPRPETEWWVELLIQSLTEKKHKEPYRILDLCAGSGAIGIALLKAFPDAEVTFAEIDRTHLPLIKKNIVENGLPLTQTRIRESDVWSALSGEVFDVIATNPPYVPTTRTLEPSVSDYEPARALYAGEDGLLVISRILESVHDHLTKDGVLWLECDSEHAQEVLKVAQDSDLSSTLHHDLYGRPRLLVSYR